MTIARVSAGLLIVALLGAGRNADLAAAANVTQQQEQKAVSLVYAYYSLWNSKKYTQMYQMFSSSFRRTHSYESWLKTHSSTLSIRVEKAHAASPDLVQVEVSSTDPVAGGGQVITDYLGTWSVVREAGSLRLDKPQFRPTNSPWMKPKCG